MKRLSIWVLALLGLSVVVEAADAGILFGRRVVNRTTVVVQGGGKVQVNNTAAVRVRGR